MLQCDWLKLVGGVINVYIYFVDNLTVTQVQQTLLEINEEALESIPVSPLDEDEGLHLDEIIENAEVRDLECNRRKRAEIFELSRVEDPGDIFLIGDKQTRNVYLQGDAGRGKTVFCLMLLSYWCGAMNSQNTNFGKWQEGLKMFDFVFYVSLRHVQNCRASLVDMICNDVFKYSQGCCSVLRKILSSSAHRCLIIVDGLDEWNPSPDVKARIGSNGFPSIDGLTNFVVFWTSRPWKLETLRPKFGKLDKLLEIFGLGDTGVENLIRRVLVNFYPSQDASEDELSKSANAIIQKSNDPILRNIMKIPLLVTALVFLWKDEQCIDNFLTKFFCQLLTLLLSRARIQKRVTTDDCESFSETSNKGSEIPKMFTAFPSLANIMTVLMTLGKVAFHGLVSDSTHLVFEKDKLERDLGKSTLDFALKVGIISQTKAHSRLHGHQVSLHFFHKTVQEFLAALYVVRGIEDVRNTLCNHCSSVSSVLELGNVFMFASGLDADVGCMLSEHIVTVANSDETISHYRQTFEEGDSRVNLVYTLQCECFRELNNSGSSVTEEAFHVSDVFAVNYESTEEIIDITFSLMRVHPHHITSLYLYRIDSIKSGELTKLLDGTSALQSLCLTGMSLFNISFCFFMLKVVSLVEVKLSGKSLFGLQTALNANANLQSLDLRNIRCGKHSIALDLTGSPGLKTLTLRSGSFSALGINNQSLERVVIGFGVTGAVTQLLSAFPYCQLLDSLHLSYTDDVVIAPCIVEIIPQLCNLREFKYGTSRNRGQEDTAYHTAVVKAILSLVNLRVINLWSIEINDNALVLSPSMTQLEEIKLGGIRCEVVMSPIGWKKFFESMLEIQHPMKLVLYGLNVDRDVMAILKTSRQYQLDCDGDETNYYYHEFSRVL